MVVEVFIKEWTNPNVTRHGRQGQAQQGVDVYGYPAHLHGAIAGVQCKNTEKLTMETVRRAVAEAQLFRPALAEFIIATTSSSDSDLQEKVRTTEWPFPVHIRFWGDLSLALSRHNDLLERFYPGWVRKLISVEDVRDLLLGCSPEDFRTISRDGQTTQVCQRDVRLCIVHGDGNEAHDAESFKAREFREPWIEHFPANWPIDGEPAYKEEIHVEFSSTRVLSMQFVWVDGGRHLMPLPASAKNLVIDEFQYHLGKIVNVVSGGTNFDDALETACFRIVPAHKYSQMEWLPRQTP